LDYSQIKAGKFRTNVKKFNIRDAIDKVMSIQSQKAKDTGLEFTARYLNIGEKEEDADEAGDMYSPYLHCDDQRIMQVLLNLQSNALKFTEKGSVCIIVSIIKV